MNVKTWLLFRFRSNSHIVCVNGRHFVTKVTLLDLDPKPDTHFAKYVKQTKEIAQAINTEVANKNCY